MATLTRTLKPRAQQTEQVLSFSEIRMVDGTITVMDAARGILEELTAVELSLAWPAIARSFGATGQFKWRGEVVRRERQRGRSARGAVGRPLRAEAAADGRAVQARVRRQHEPAAFAQARRHARGRRQIAARGAALDRASAGARRRLRPVRLQVADNVRVRKRGVLRRQHRARRQCRRRRDGARDRTARRRERHARRRCARSHALRFHHRGAARERSQLEPRHDFGRRAQRSRSRSAPVGGARDGRDRAARPHRRRRQPARRQAHARDRRGAGLWRRASRARSRSRRARPARR